MAGEQLRQANAAAASMKALPKRKGNSVHEVPEPADLFASMKALPKRKGNSFCGGDWTEAKKPQ